jgi:hypothetical protein
MKFFFAAVYIFKLLLPQTVSKLLHLLLNKGELPTKEGNNCYTGTIEGYDENNVKGTVISTTAGTCHVTGYKGYVVNWKWNYVRIACQEIVHYT